MGAYSELLLKDISMAPPYSSWSRLSGYIYSKTSILDLFADIVEMIFTFYYKVSQNINQ